MEETNKQSLPIRSAFLMIFRCKACSSHEEYHMNLLPKHLRKQLPSLYEKEGLGLAAQATIKFFLPGTGWTWYPTEFDGDDILFGLVIGHVAEFGYFRLSELEELRSPLGLPVERDLYFKSSSLGDLRDHYEKDGWAL